MAKIKTARDRYEESLRGPEPPSNMFRIATVIWIILTVAAMAGVMYLMPNSRQLPKLLVYIPAGSAALYAIAAHQNRLGDRGVD